MSLLSRFRRFIVWIVLIITVLLAVLATGFRFLMPNIDNYQSEIEAQLSKIAGIDVHIGDIKGHWLMLSPRLRLQDVTLSLKNEDTPVATIGQAVVELDVLSSIFTLQPQLGNIEIHALEANVSRWDLLSDLLGLENNVPQITPNQSVSNSSDFNQTITSFLFKQIKTLNIQNSHITYKALDEDIRIVDITSFDWRNTRDSHTAQGLLSIEGSNINQMKVGASFDDKNSFNTIDGEFFISVEDVNILPWMTKWLQKETNIQSGLVSVSAWFDLKDSTLTDMLVKLDSSQLTWKNKEENQTFSINSGLLKLIPKQSGWIISSEQFDFSTNDTTWNDFSFLVDWQKDYKQLNIAQLQLKNLLPLLSLIPNQENLLNTLNQFNPQGTIKDIRIYQPKDITKSLYSLTFEQGSLQAWQNIPGIHDFSANLVGDYNHAQLDFGIKDEILPYPLVIKAPLNITSLDGQLLFARTENSWSVEANKIKLTTPDIQLLSSFRLLFPYSQAFDHKAVDSSSLAQETSQQTVSESASVDIDSSVSDDNKNLSDDLLSEKPLINNSSPLLSMYTEVSLKDVKQAENYFPKNVLGPETDQYLSKAIQGGELDARILWYGELDAFPYDNKDGIFQAKVEVKKGTFEFSPEWPPLTDLDLNLFFENYALYVDSLSAQLMDVHATKISGEIPTLTSDGVLSLSAQANGTAEAATAYINKTPLADSVGTALTSVAIKGPINANLQLTVPLTGLDVNGKGEIILSGNPINIKSPEINLTQAKGSIYFDDDKIKTEQLTANWFNDPINLNVTGQSKDKNYQVAIEATGKNVLTILNTGYSSPWWQYLEGKAPWKMNTNLQITRDNIHYQADSQFDLTKITSNYPAPLDKKANTAKSINLKVSGDQNRLSLNATMPQVQYQAKMSFSDKNVKTNITDSRIIIGTDKNLTKAYQGHSFVLNQNKFNADPWLDLFTKSDQKKNSSNLVSSEGKPASELSSTFPLPKKINLTVNQFILNKMDWNNVRFTASERNNDWSMQIQSRELEGNGRFRNQKYLTLNMKTVHLFFPEWDVDEDDALLSERDDNKPLVTQFDRDFYNKIIDLDIKINNLWLQGYKVGNAAMVLKRTNDKLVWENLELITGTNHLKSSGWWQLKGEKSLSNFTFNLQGENNSDVMARFGIYSGIQDSKFNISLASSWNGSPWGMQMDTLNGQLSTEFEDGKISDVNGTARLLGLFSLDSLINKMKLDFTGVFDNGMSFSSIKGTGKIVRGVFRTDDLEMDGSAGDMELMGKADLVKQTVDANVVFYPDLTSSLPVITAFAVTPETALAVLAVTTIFSPVIDVFTKVEYKVEGPIESPNVTEVSRSQGKVNTSKTLNKNDFK